MNESYDPDPRYLAASAVYFESNNNRPGCDSSRFGRQLYVAPATEILKRSSHLRVDGSCFWFQAPTWSFGAIATPLRPSASSFLGQQPRAGESVLHASWACSKPGGIKKARVCLVKSGLSHAICSCTAGFITAGRRSS